MPLSAVVRVAAEARVGTVVLTHLWPLARRRGPGPANRGGIRRRRLRRPGGVRRRRPGGAGVKLTLTCLPTLLSPLSLEVVE